MNDATFNELFECFRNRRVGPMDAYLLVLEVEAIFEKPVDTPHGLKVCAVCHTPVRRTAADELREHAERIERAVAQLAAITKTPPHLVPKPEPEGAEAAKP